MEIDVRFRALQASNALREYVARRIHFQLSRFNGEVRSVHVSISDVNGPKGGPDKRCQVTVRGRALGPVRVVDRSEDAYSVVDMAVERAARAVGREIERMRAVRRPVGAVGTTSRAARVARPPRSRSRGDSVAS